MGCGPRALAVRARRARQRAKQTLHAVKLRGGDAFLYDVATAKSASTETSSVGSSAPRERRPLATELVSVGAGGQPTCGRRVLQNHTFQRVGIRQLVGTETSSETLSTEI